MRKNCYKPQENPHWYIGKNRPPLTPFYSSLPKIFIGRRLIYMGRR